VIFEKMIELPYWGIAEREKVVSYWKEQRFAFTKVGDDLLTARRGNIFGNLFSFDSRKLMARLVITRPEPTSIWCVMEVNTAFQEIVEWNIVYWQLEMATLESWLLQGDRRTEHWELFMRAYREAALTWIKSGTRKGRSVPPELKV
jgi:hypothetical protein